MTMRYQGSLLVGTTADNDAYLGFPGELTIDTDLGTARIHNGVLTGGFQIVSSSDDAILGDVDLGENAAGDHTLTIHSGTDSINIALTTETDVAPIGLFANGTDLNLTSTHDINLIPTGANINFGAAASANQTLTIYSGTSGDHFTLTTASDAVTLTGVGTGVDFIVVAADDIHLRPAGGDVYIGTSAGGTRTLTLYSGTSGDTASLISATGVVTLDSTGGLLRLAAEGAIQLRPSDLATSQLIVTTGATSIGEDAVIDQTLTIYSGTAGDYATLTTASNLVTLSAVGTGNVLALAAASNITLAPGGGSAYLTVTSSSAQFGADGTLAASVYCYGSSAGQYIRWTYDEIESVGQNLNLTSTTANVVIRPADTVYATFAATGLAVTNSATGALSVLLLTQADDDEPFINYAGTTEAGVTKSLSSYATPGAVQGHVRVAINGTDYWMPYYAAPSA